MVRYHEKNGIKQHWNRTRQTIEKSWKSLRNGEIDETWQKNTDRKAGCWDQSQAINQQLTDLEKSRVYISEQPSDGNVDWWSEPAKRQKLRNQGSAQKNLGI